MEQSKVEQESRWLQARRRLVAGLADQGIRSAEVLAAMQAVPRHRFVPAALRERSYENVPLPIGLDQTISQPYIVALMSELAAIGPQDKVLVVGTGSGYQDAVVAQLAGEVLSVERLPELAQLAASRLSGLGYFNVQVRVGDGYDGWAEAAPFKAILVTAAAPHIPPALIDQLSPNGRLVIPVGQAQQQLRVLIRTDGGIEDNQVVAVQFVPLLPGAPDTVVRHPGDC